MKHFYRLISITFLFFLFTSTSFARGIQMRFNGFYWNEDEKNNDATSTETQKTIGRGDLGYRIGGRFAIILGGFYSSMNRETTPNAGAGSTKKLTGYGPWFGIEMGNFDLDGFYYIDPKYKENNTGAVTSYEGGSGMEFNVGYMIPLSGWAALGPRLYYRTFQWDTNKDTGLALTSKEEWTDTGAYVSLEITIGGSR